MGREPPQAFYYQPEIPEYLLPLWSAFNDLSSERQIGMGLGPISRSKIRQYVADEMGLAGDAADAAFRVLTKADEAYLSMSNSKDKDKQADEIPISDTGAVRRMLHRLSVRAKKKP